MVASDVCFSYVITKENYIDLYPVVCKCSLRKEWFEVAGAESNSLMRECFYLLHPGTLTWT